MPRAVIQPRCVFSDQDGDPPLHAACPARAEYPERLIRAIVPFSTGGTNDITARLIAPHLGKRLGQSVVVENRPGAAGNIGIEATARSAPDGYTILFSATASTQNPALFRNLRFDPITDIQPVAAITEYPYAIVINTHLPVKSVRDLIKLAQKNAGRLNASAGGIGTRLSVELFKIRNNIRVEVISYSGSGQAALAVATGETQLAIMDTSPFLPFLATGRVRLLAVAGDRRLPSFPDTPTTAEAGLPDYKAGTTAAVYVAGRTPAVIVQKLSAAINHVISLPEVREQLQKLGGNSAPASADEFTQWYRREIQLWKDIVARAQIPPLD
ncbi:MAG: tripartite tricarboxylate transporter substrate binding protein [Betaproteobacteria bacterium]|nr:tripartite tricarboxylate transporter substrate binding protein [Betaproteobacteria bacterium]